VKKGSYTTFNTVKKRKIWKIWSMTKKVIRNFRRENVHFFGKNVIQKSWGQRKKISSTPNSAPGLRHCLKVTWLHLHDLTWLPTFVTWVTTSVWFYLISAWAVGMGGVYQGLGGLSPHGARTMGKCVLVIANNNDPVRLQYNLVGLLKIKLQVTT